MNKARMALLTACCLVGILLAGCSDSASGKQAGEADQAAMTFTQGKALSASFTDPLFTDMKGVAENDQLRLFADDQTGAIAVLNKKSGEVWRSNPPGSSEDAIAAGVNKDLLSSQIKLDFYNDFGQLNSINSYTDSVVNKQISMEKLPNGLSVTYQFGKVEKTLEDMPKMMSKELFDAANKKLDKTGQRALKIAYKENKEQTAYERNDSALNGLQLDRALKALEAAGYTEEDLKKDMEELHFTQEKTAPRIFEATIKYTLDGNSLVAAVPVADIHYPEEYPVNSVSFLNFFGAGGTGDKGTMLVPDGSGALIRFNSGKTRYPSYQQLVYGQDNTMARTEDASREEAVRLPVFGIIRENGAFLGIIEQGESVATINADISGRLNSYNYVYPSFNVINKGQVTLDANGQQRSLPKFQENPMKSDFVVRYAFLSGEDASYQGMASYYKEYLVNHKALPVQEKAADGENIPFYLQLDGSITDKKHFMGIPYRALETLTTFKEAKSIINQMKQLDIHNIKLKYAGWFNGGLDHKVPKSISVDGEIGGSQGLKDLASFAAGNGVALYPDVAFLTANTGNDFNESKSASRTLRGDPAALYPADLALNRRDISKSPSYIVSPRLVDGFVDSTLKGMNKFNANGISVRDLADQLNSDYRKHNQIDRTESEEISRAAMAKLKDQKLQVMGNGGNAYALPYLSDLTNAPMGNSGFKLEDEQIPFYQMVIRGSMEYTGAPYNLSNYTNDKQYILKCLEFGSNVYFEWIYEPSYSVKDTDHNELYAVNYKLWMDKAAGMYQEVNKVLKNVKNEPITGHEKLQQGVYKTVYGNGLYVIVNYNRSQVTVEGKSIEAESYLTGGDQS
ncbi:DUF5696 domain-containing protein [Paenibacillus sp. JDR-2]|uniref:DUF5696 domain-containing protein n=1 Tax=Paenibacillus sp. (strain JDR-2) TaxID=324057 RepID=UPI0001663E36|nr:DUF5696 domain-containing protein [Paenibacillus sp. JDR-2]ACT02873.1 hypothetical protein Pjdr2_4247 [Paenibacillus sp. JDR-2]